MEDYQEDLLQDIVDGDFEEGAEDEDENFHPCGCGSHCFNCLGMTWRDFL